MYVPLLSVVADLLLISRVITYLLQDLVINNVEERRE